MPLDALSFDQKSQEIQSILPGVKVVVADSPTHTEAVHIEIQSVDRISEQQRAQVAHILGYDVIIRYADKATQSDRLFPQRVARG